MKEIKVGEYVRFKDGKIRKIIGQDKDNHLIVDIFIYGGNWLTFNEKDNIVKHSPNIIDLIQVGDYVNEHKVVNEIWGEDDNNLYFEIEGGFNKAQYIGEKDIKSIVTKEQFKSMEYKLEE